MLKFLLVALLAVAVSATGEEHDAAIAEVAQEMPEHAVAFAELAAAAGTDDVFTVLDAMSSNIEAERKHAEGFFKSYQKTTQRDLKKYNLLVAKLSAHERRNKGMTEAERKEIKQLRRAVNANVRSLSRAVERFQHVQQQEKRTTYKKKAAMRHLNNKIADRKTFLKVLRVIRKALQSDKPVTSRFLEALSVAQSHGISATSDNVLLQISSEEAIGQETDNSDEVEADAEIDHEAFEMDSMPSADELSLMDEAEDEAEESDEEEAEEEEQSEEAEEEQSEDSADAALDAADATEEEEVEEVESAEDSESAAEDEAEADSEDEVDEASQARMMQVLEKLSAGARDDDSVADLLALIDSLIADVKESIAGAKKRKVAVLTKYTAQMKNLQQLANSIKASIRRLQAVVQTGRSRVAELEQSTHAVDANTKENDAQLKAYRSMRKGIKSNWAKYKTRYEKNQSKRTKQLEQLAELKRRLAAVERTKGALSVDLSKVNLRYRWKAGPFGGCQAPCGPSTRSRKVQCLSFSGKPVKHTFCEGQKKPKTTVKCQKKLCPIDCVMGEWKPRGKCSNQCGTGVRVMSRSVVEPARFGGRCPKQFKLTKNKPCRSMKGCASAVAKAQALAAAKAAPKAQAQAQAQAKAPLTAAQQKKRLRNKRCLACKKGDFKCALKNCMNKTQRNACKACKKGKDGKKCRAAKCRAVFQARRKTLKARKAARKAERKVARKAERKAARKAAAAASAPQTEGKEYKWSHTPRNRRCLKCVKGERKCKHNNCMWKAQRKACKSCGGKDGAKACRRQKCSAVIEARREHLRRAAARRTRCMNCKKGQGKCKRQNCLTKAQLKECKTCAAGDAGKACRIEKCRGPANARRQHLIKTAKNNRCMKCAKRGRGAPECKFHNCLNKAQKATCKSCKEGDDKCREEKCRSVWRAQRKALFAAEAKAIAAKEAGQTSAAKKQVKKNSKKAKKAKKQAKKAKKQAKKQAKKCERKCRSGKKGKKCRRACRERRAAKKAAKAAAKAKVDAPVAPIAPAKPAPAAAAPAPADDSMSPEVVIPKFRALSL